MVLIQQSKEGVMPSAARSVSVFLVSFFFLWAQEPAPTPFEMQNCWPEYEIKP
jgi:hypothetical protein